MGSFVGQHETSDNLANLPTCTCWVKSVCYRTSVSSSEHIFFRWKWIIWWASLCFLKHENDCFSRSISSCCALGLVLMPTQYVRKEYGYIAWIGNNAQTEGSLYMESEEIGGLCQFQILYLLLRECVGRVENDCSIIWLIHLHVKMLDNLGRLWDKLKRPIIWLIHLHASVGWKVSIIGQLFQLSDSLANSPACKCWVKSVYYRTIVSTVWWFG